MDFIYEKNSITLYGESGTLLAEVTFPSISESIVDINHTFVDSSLRGQGVAHELMIAAAEYLKQQNKKAKLTCSYAITWFEQHPEYSFLLDQ